MRVIFLGTPEFSVKVLDGILKSRHEVVAVVTQPDKPAGRHGTISFCRVKEYALDKGIPVLQYGNISKEGEEDLKKLSADIMVTCAYGQILRQNILDICEKGIINVHASLLPKYRGSSPVQWTLADGEQLGISIMQTELGIDTGAVIIQKPLDYSGFENHIDALNALSILGAELIVEALNLIEENRAVFTPQDNSKATHCRMLTREDGLIDFNSSAESVVNRIRAFNPWPGAFFNSSNGIIKVHKAEIFPDIDGACGEVIFADHKNGLVVKCQTGCVKFLIIQGENAKSMTAESYFLGKKILTGSILNG